MEQDDWTQVISFSRSEQRGISVLIFLCLFSVAYSYVVPEWISRQEIRKFETQLQAVMPQSDTSILRALPAELLVGERHIENTVPARTQQEALDDSKHVPAPKRKIAQPVVQASEIRINSSTAREIIQTRRLPDVIAFRLVRFREDIGGFNSIEQLRDIYGMTDSMYNNMLDLVVFEKIELKIIYVNSATLEELYKHPYISKGLAQQMINFREKVKPFASSEDLLRLYFMDESLLEKLTPYISFY